ncbi:MAG: hypothetical protein SFW67_25410 [Myxococcaceae bacterium]|nr:hypothetical protein [Myxococcaceae bacterium]
MAAILGLVGLLVSLVNLAALIIFLIQLYKAKGVGHAIAGFCCGLYTLIWGWQNADALDASNPPVVLKYKQWIMIWTAAILGNIVINIAVQAMARM